MEHEPTQDELDETLLWTSEKGHLSIVKMMILAKANPNTQKGDRNPPLLRTANEQIAKFLLQNKADVNFRSYFGRTALHNACARFYQESIIRELICEKADVNLQDERGNTPLHHAALYGQSRNVEILLNARARMDIKDGMNHIAQCNIRDGDNKCLEFFVLNGAQIDKNNKSHQRFMHNYIRILKSSLPLPVNGGHFLLHSELRAFSFAMN